ncbi:MAG: hypothetical protein RLY31_1875 [Bacteroidota bacterium]
METFSSSDSADDKERSIADTKAARSADSSPRAAVNKTPASVGTSANLRCDANFRCPDGTVSNPTYKAAKKTENEITRNQCFFFITHSTLPTYASIPYRQSSDDSSAGKWSTFSFTCSKNTFAGLNAGM